VRAERVKAAPARPSDVTPIPKRTAAAATLGDPSSPEVAALEDALKAWRSQRAKADKVSAFIVASNALLRAIAETRPATAQELFRVKGMGPTKLDLYGDEILSVLDGLP
jgi:DNA helicase-2/ATP-dependent DNA helicase PcrA